MRWLIAILSFLLGGFSAGFQEGGKSDPADAAPRVISFSGYEWTVKSSQKAVGPGPNRFGPEGVRVDGQGRLHLTIAQKDGRWICSEIVSKRSFGFGHYGFVVRETANLDINAVLGLFLWDPAASDQNFREVDIEVSRWGDPKKANAQFVKQSFRLPENIDRFELPAGRARASFDWLPGRLFFQASSSGKPVRRHLFTKGLFEPGSEQVRLNLWLFQSAPPTDGRAVEVVIESFKFLPIKKGK